MRAKEQARKGNKIIMDLTIFDIVKSLLTSFSHKYMLFMNWYRDYARIKLNKTNEKRKQKIKR